MNNLKTGPEWTEEVFEEYLSFLRDNVLGTLKHVVQELDTPREEHEH